MSGENKYGFESLLAKAKAAGLWIDVADKKTMRGRGSGNTNNKERVSRALSWHGRSESVDGDDRLICAFIAFNALYSQHRESGADISEGKYASEELAQRRKFLSRIKKLAKDGRAADYFNFSPAEIKKMEKIISFQYLMPAYWKDEGDYVQKFTAMNDMKARAALTAGQIKNKNAAPLEVAVTNVYWLRNQVFHGMAAYNDGYNRKQIKLCADFLHGLVGRLLAVVMNNPAELWGKVAYPPQGKPNEKNLDVETLGDGVHD